MITPPSDGETNNVTQPCDEYCRYSKRKRTDFILCMLWFSLRVIELCDSPSYKMYDELQFERKLGFMKLEMDIQYMQIEAPGRGGGGGHLGQFLLGMCH